MINAISSQQDFRRKAEFAKSIIGYDLLNYTLNTSQFNNSQGQALTLSPQQEQALSSLCLNLQCALKRSIESFTSTDYPIVELQRLQYNTYRKQSGGKTPDFITDDPLLNFIIEQVIKVFPRLLMIGGFG